MQASDSLDADRCIKTAYIPNEMPGRYLRAYKALFFHFFVVFCLEIDIVLTLYSRSTEV